MDASLGKFSVRGVNMFALAVRPRGGCGSGSASSIGTSSPLVICGFSVRAGLSSTCIRFSSGFSVPSFDSFTEALLGTPESTAPVVLPLTDLLSETEAGRLAGFSGSSECCRFEVEFWRMREEAGLEVGGS